MRSSRVEKALKKLNPAGSAGGSTALVSSHVRYRWYRAVYFCQYFCFTIDVFTWFPPPPPPPSGGFSWSLKVPTSWKLKNKTDGVVGGIF
jgi:hypothetical protein